MMRTIFIPDKNNPNYAIALIYARAIIDGLQVKAYFKPSGEKEFVWNETLRPAWFDTMQFKIVVGDDTTGFIEHYSEGMKCI